ncbi:MAG: aldo/keto reductase [Hyphomicrobiales bacterium]|nr:aldo/keto reductase [Hyphomicrobiales bacterium]
MIGSMHKRVLGASDIETSVIGLGTWAMGGWKWGGSEDAVSVAAIEASIDRGATLIDTAPAYGLGRAEEIVGRAIAGKREKVVISTKCGLVWHTGGGRHFFDQDGKSVHRYLGRGSIIHEVEQSLRRLGTDYIDHYIAHWQDPTTPIEETMGALTDLKAQGKIRSIGVSNASIDDLDAYIAAGQLDAVQEKYNMLDRGIEETLLPVCRENGVGCMSYSSLALGLLSGKIGPERAFKGDDLRKTKPHFSVDNREKMQGFASLLKPIAKSYDLTVAQLVIAWTLAQKGITFALCGARNPAQAVENAKAGQVTLSQGDLLTISGLVDRRLAGFGA